MMSGVGRLGRGARGLDPLVFGTGVDETRAVGFYQQGCNAASRSSDPSRTLSQGWVADSTVPMRGGVDATIRCVGAGLGALQTASCARLTRPIGRCNQLGAVAGVFGFSELRRNRFNRATGHFVDFLRDERVEPTAGI